MTRSAYSAAWGLYFFLVPTDILSIEWMPIDLVPNKVIPIDSVFVDLRCPLT